MCNIQQSSFMLSRKEQNMHAVWYLFVNLSVSHFPLDRCFTSLLFQSWFCPWCGFELCNWCYNALLTLKRKPSMPCVNPRCKSWFHPVAVFTAEVLEEHLSAMEAMLALPPPKDLDAPTNIQPIITEANRHMEPAMQNMCKYKVGELNSNLLFEKWRSCEPFVLMGITNPTNPEELLDLKKNKQKHCTTTFYNGEMWCMLRSMLGAYFKI